MGKIGGFKEFNRADEGNIAVVERVANYNEFTIALPKDKIKEAIGRSPDFWDTILMREWFELKPTFVLTATKVA